MKTDLLERPVSLDRKGGPCAADGSDAAVAGLGGRIQSWLLGVTWTAFAAFFAYSLTTFFYFNLPSSGALGALALSVPSAGAVALIYLFAPRLASLGPAEVLPRIRTNRDWLLLCLVVGGLARLAWALWLPIDLTAPSPIFDVATRIIEKGVYETGGEHGLLVAKAFYPPGNFFFQVPFVLLFGDSGWVAFLIGMLLFAACVLVVHALASELFDRTTARVATLMVTIWPIHLYGAVLSTKEQLLTVLVPLTFLVYLRSKARETEDRAAWRWLALVGFLCGLTSLVQPALVLVFTAFVANELIWDRLRWRHLARWAVIVLCMAVTISPWSIRNYLVFGAFVPLTSAAGYGLHMANNSQAHGAWMRLVDIEALHAKGASELEGSRAAGELGKEWIKNNPVAFLGTIPRKLGVLMSREDDYIVKVINLAGGEDKAEWLYEPPTSFSTAFWLSFMGLILAYVFRARWRWREQGSGASLMMLAMLYQASVSIVFIAADRYHYGVAVMLSCLAAAALRPARTAAAARQP